MVLVVKIGDRVLNKVLSEAGLTDLHRVSQEIPTVLVHGGGDTVTSVAQSLGLEQRFVVSPEGFRSRYTNAETIEVFTMVMAGKINKEIVRRLQSRGIRAVGLSGLDGGLIRASRKERIIVKDDRGRRRVIDGGYTGRITGVAVSLMRSLLAENYLPVIAPVALGEQFESLNVDGDRAAASIATAIHADVLLLLTDVEGVSIGGSVSRELSLPEAKSSIPKLGGGMITKVHAGVESLEKGVRRVIIASGSLDAPFTSALELSQGTLITA
jgi:[amino group carrier protein]-L-2-aminoadipate 6-kinase